MLGLATTNSTIPSHANTVEASPISGIYGPGSWAAWMLATISSLCVMRHQPNRHTILSMILPALYINWAAVDLLKQVYSPEQSLEQFASANGITFWGLWYFFALPHVLYRVQGQHEGVIAVVWRIRVLTLLSSCVPIIAMFAGIDKLSQRGEMNFHTSARTTSRREVNNSSSPDLVSTTSSGILSYWLCVLVAAFHFGLLLFQQILNIAGMYRVDRGFISIPSKFFFFNAVLIMYVFLKETAHFRWKVTDINGDPTFCLLRPCGPQNLAESDQGFSLCCGLLLFWYETGPDVVPLVAVFARSVRRHIQVLLKAILGDLLEILPSFSPSAIWASAKTSTTTFWSSIQHYILPPTRAISWPGPTRRERSDLESQWNGMSEREAPSSRLAAVNNELEGVYEPDERILEALSET